MPLIDPVTSSSGGKGGDWMTKLMGKTLGDNHNETTFAKKDLPSGHRVVESEGGMMTMDHNPDRMNIHVDKDGTVKKVTHG